MTTGFQCGHGLGGVRRADVVTEDGEPALKSKGVAFVGKEGDRVVFKVGSARRGFVVSARRDGRLTRPETWQNTELREPQTHRKDRLGVLETGETPVLRSTPNRAGRV